MQATMTDDRRRVVLPDTIPARSAVTIQQLDEDTLVIRRQRPHKHLVAVLEPDVKRLPEDAEWEKVERAFADSANRNLPEPKE